MENLLDNLKSLLQKDKRLVSEGELLKNKIIELALKLDKDLLRLLLSDKKMKEVFFVDIDQTLVFDKEKFIRFVSNKQFLPDSYTAFKNKIGLTSEDDYLSEKKEVVLSWPYKDCVLEGGMTKEDQKRDEIFWNETLAPDEITRLLDPKVLTNAKRIDKTGEHKLDKFKTDESGDIKDNLIIKGNNLLALHSLKKRFAGKVKLIYIDPPYNPRSDANTFAYNNSFNHSSWLVFMKNRLEIARELLSDDGLIFIDIDHNELFYLGVLADEIFGYGNRIGVLAVVHNLKGRYKEFFSTAHENKIVYAKNAQKAKIKDFSEDLTDYPLEDKIGRYKIIGLQRTGSGSRREDRPKLFYPIYINKVTKAISTEKKQGWIEVLPIDPRGIERRWRWDKTKVGKDWKTEIIIKENKEEYKIYTKLRSHGKKPKTIWFKPKYSSTSGTNELKNLLGENEFSYPKSVELVKDTIKIATNKNDVVFDFFAGSGTTAQAVLELNKEDKGKRQFIICEQLDYVDTVTLPRVKKVIKKLGGGDFVYLELMKWNENFVEKIRKARTKADFKKLWEIMKKKAFLSYKVEPKVIDENAKDFADLSIENQKRFLFECLDKNHLYVNYSEIDDEEYKVSREDKKVNREFYK